jgi:hypothetical protein
VDPVDPDPGGPKTRGSGGSGSGFGSGSATLLKSNKTNRNWSNFIGLGYFMALLILNNAKAL